MTKRNKRILGINPGTRYLGLAVFNGLELVDWRIKTFNGKWTKEKVNRILKVISKQIELCDINTISLKKLHPSRSSNNLRLLILKIMLWAKRKRIKVYRYSIKELENYFSNGEKPNKKHLAEKVVSEYPVLIHELEREKAKKSSYYLRAFEAVALGMLV